MSPKSEEKLCSIIRLLLGEPPINNYRRGTGKPVSLFFCGEGIGLLTDTGDAISGKTGVFSAVRTEERFFDEKTLKWSAVLVNKGL